MNDDSEDFGLTVNGLWATAWLLGLIALGSLLRLLTYAADEVPAHAELFVWVLIGTIAAAFSACCAVLAGVKSAEQRIARRVGQSMV